MSGEGRYLAGISIGPVFKAILEAENTRGTWAASYFFSRLSRLLAHRIQNAGKKYELWLPVLTDQPYPTGGTGIYPDRLYFTVQTSDLSCIKAEIVDPILSHLSIETGCPESFLSQYLRIAVLAKPLIDEFENPLIALGGDLDTCDFDYHPWPGQHDLLQEYFRMGSKSPMIIESFGEHFEGFDSILQISASQPLKEAKKKNPGKFSELLSLMQTSFAKESIVESVDEARFFKELTSTAPDTSRFTCKYLAILVMDGDNVGAMMKAISKKEHLLGFGAFMNAYSGVSTTLVREFGGTMIYAGGDDLFAFCPVAGSNGETIMDLCNSLERHYKDLFNSNSYLFGNEGVEPPCMSFGVYIQYYKSPLFEGISYARGLLDEAKSSGKNRLAIAFEPHASNASKAVLNKGIPATASIKKFIQYCSAVGADSLSGRIKALQNQKDILEVFVSDPFTNHSCFAFLQNTTRTREESETNSGRINSFIENVVPLADGLFAETTMDVLERGKMFDFVLRFAYFINRKDDWYNE